jgi:hypothetical protein
VGRLYRGGVMILNDVFDEQDRRRNEEIAAAARRHLGQRAR